MTAHDAVTAPARFALVTVQIATNGTRCGDACPYLAPWDATADADDEDDQPHRCALFRADVDTVHDALDFCRVPQCLALDAPSPDLDRTPEEAMAHGFGSQP